MILRATGLILVMISAAIGVATFWQHTDFATGSATITSLLALVAFGSDRFSKKKDQSPLFAVQFEELRFDNRAFDAQEGDLAFSADFKLTNHGDSVADVEAVGGGRFKVQITGPRNVPAGKDTIVSIFPFTRNAEVPFKIKYRSKHSIESVSCVFRTKPVSLKIGA